MIDLVIDLCNSVAVSLFGIVLSAAFCNISWTAENKKKFLLCVAGILSVAGIVYIGMDPNIGRYFYPLHTHLPLILALCWLSREKLWPVISVLTAYLCCQLRRWLALVVIAIFAGGDTMQYITEMIVTVPLLILLLKAAPAIRSVSQYSVAVQLQFGSVPALYYAFDYITRVYTTLLSSGSPVVVEFMPFVRLCGRSMRCANPSARPAPTVTTCGTTCNFCPPVWRTASTSRRRSTSAPSTRRSRPAA